MPRVYNFSAGPSMLPEPVLRKAASEMLDYGGSGQSVMEMSHRSKVYEEIQNAAECGLRELMGIPGHYKVLFLQGGASLQFAMVPLNLFRATRKADFINTGTWPKKAISEAKRYGSVKVVVSSEDKAFNYIPVWNAGTFTPDADYVHICTNNTIEGTRFVHLPDTGSVPLVADMSSNILSQSYDVGRFGLIFAGAQKNVGPAGVTVVIIREDLIGHAMDITPTMLNYKTHAEENSLYNTPPCFAIYIAKLTFDWIRDLGGVGAMQQINEEKAGILYDFLDSSAMFKGTADRACRSLMNVPFVSPRDELNEKFLKEATKAGFINLKGHRSVGGMRASIYNAMPVEGVKKLVDFMKKFEMENKST